MTDHPMSEGQTRKVWRVEYVPASELNRAVYGTETVRNLVPCRVEDLRVGDHHVVEGMESEGVFVVVTAPVVQGGVWEAQAMTVSQWQDIQDGKAEIVRQDGKAYHVTKTSICEATGLGNC